MNSAAGTDDLIRVPVRMELLDGQRMDVSIISPRALLKMHELLNREEKFIDIEGADGERFSIAKSAIKSVKGRETPKVRNLHDLTQDKNGFDPYRILNIPKDSGAEVIRQAYLVLVREYHTDKFASVDLPREVAEYLQNMLRRINAAYDMLVSKAA